MQAPLAVLGSLLAFLAWRRDRNSAWLIGGFLLFAIVPFTLIVIFPTNKLLESDRRDLTSTQAENSDGCGVQMFLNRDPTPLSTPLTIATYLRRSGSEARFSFPVYSHRAGEHTP